MDKKKQALQLGINFMKYAVQLGGHTIEPFTIDFPEAIQILESLLSDELGEIK